MSCIVNTVKEATPPLLEMRHGSLLPTAVPWPLEPAAPRKGAHPGKMHVPERCMSWKWLCWMFCSSLIHNTHVNKAQHGLPGSGVSGCLGIPGDVESLQGIRPTVR